MGYGQVGGGYEYVVLISYIDWQDALIVIENGQGIFFISSFIRYHKKNINLLHFNLRLFTMMNIRVKLLVAIILYQFFLFVHAQGLIDVRHYSIEDGLSQNIVQDMLQDDDGYIWLATWNGLENMMDILSKIISHILQMQ